MHELHELQELTPVLARILKKTDHNWELRSALVDELVKLPTCASALAPLMKHSNSSFRQDVSAVLKKLMQSGRLDEEWGRLDEEGANLLLPELLKLFVESVTEGQHIFKSSYEGLLAKLPACAPLVVPLLNYRKYDLSDYKAKNVQAAAATLLRKLHAEGLLAEQYVHLAAPGSGQ